MKYTRIFVLLALLSAAPAFAQQATSARTLPAWEQLSAAERDALTAPVRERWNAQPAERARMLERAHRWQTMTPQQRQKLHRGARRWAHMNPAQREQTRALFQQMRQMTPEQRQQLRANWKSMTPEQRKAWMQEHATEKR
ncbi:MAG TPA: DUF3106 domain-containing protein [Lysobacter sp.]|jgi:hypothetical protein|nr:DUF3106 domain-containing protein [Lysobacter sp.]